MRMRRGTRQTERKARVGYQDVQHSERGFMDVWFALVARRKGRRARHPCFLGDSHAPSPPTLYVDPRNVSSFNTKVPLVKGNYGSGPGAFSKSHRVTSQCAY